MSEGRKRLRAVIYARISLDRTGEGLAVERQVEDCRALAAARGWDVVEVVVDNSISASTGKERAGYDRVLALVRSRSVDRVVVWHLDRLVRRTLDLEHVVELCEAADVRVATVTGDLDLSTDAGRLLARILAAVARAEVERKGARQQAAGRQRRAGGVMLWTRRPFGYDRVGTKVIVVEHEAAALRDAAAAAIAGTPLAEVARRMNEAGALTTVGNPWRYMSLRRALLNPRYVGQVTYLGAATGIEGRWPAILTPDDHARLVELITDPVRRTTSSTQLKHWLSGALECGRCGAAMYSGRVRDMLVYQCRTPHLLRGMLLVDDVVTARLLARISRPEFAAAFETGDGADLRNQLHELRTRRSAMTASMAEGILDPAEAAAHLRRLAAQIDQLHAQLAGQATTGTLGMLREDPAHAEQVWAGLSVRQRREVFSDVVERAVIAPVGRGASREALIRSVGITWC